eukprot:3475077-Pyramimonas_sp.AAC.1
MVVLGALVLDDRLCQQVVQRVLVARLRDLGHQLLVNRDQARGDRLRELLDEVDLLLLLLVLLDAGGLDKGAADVVEHVGKVLEREQNGHCQQVEAVVHSCARERSAVLVHIAHVGHADDC